MSTEIELLEQTLAEAEKKIEELEKTNAELEKALAKKPEIHRPPWLVTFLWTVFGIGDGEVKTGKEPEQSEEGLEEEPEEGPEVVPTPLAHEAIELDEEKMVPAAFTDEPAKTTWYGFSLKKQTEVMISASWFSGSGGSPRLLLKEQGSERYIVTDRKLLGSAIELQLSLHPGAYSIACQDMTYASERSPRLAKLSVKSANVAKARGRAV